MNRNPSEWVLFPRTTHILMTAFVQVEVYWNEIQVHAFKAGRKQAISYQWNDMVKYIAPNQFTSRPLH